MEAETANDTTVEPSVWWSALRQAAIAIAISSLVLLVVYSLWFFDFHPEFKRFSGRDAQPETILGRHFQPVVVGGGGILGNAAIVQDFADDQAVLARQTAFEAEDFPFIKFNLSGLTRFTNAYVFWRRAADPDQLHSLPLNRSGDEVTQVAMVYGGDNYKGLITELTIVFYDGPAKGFSNNNDVDIRLESAELLPFSALRVAEQIWEDWVNPPLWQGYSNNRVRGIHENGMVFPNLVLNLLVATSALLLVLAKLVFSHRFSAPHSISRTILLVIGLCWVMGDSLRWLWRIEQLIDTHERYSGLPLEERIRNNPIRCERFPDDCRADLLPYF